MRVEGNASKDLSHAAARRKEEIKRAAHINAAFRWHWLGPTIGLTWLCWERNSAGLGSIGRASLELIRARTMLEREKAKGEDKDNFSARGL